MSKNRARVLIVDDSRNFQGAVRSLVKNIDWLDLAGAVGSGEEALEFIEREQPDLVLMDLNLPGIDGIEATRRIRAKYSDIRVVVMTMMGSTEHIGAALAGGAHGFILKADLGQHLLPIIQAIFKPERDQS